MGDLRYYFELQILRLNRWFKEIGVNHILGYILAGLLFIGLSEFLFIKTDYAQWIYVLFGISWLLNLGEANRNNFLISIYSNKDYRKVRIIENGISILPFTFYLIYEKNYLIAIGLFLLSFIFATFKPKKFGGSTTIPTPFKRFPFEFIIGFRKSMLFLLLICFLTYKSIEVNNFNLGLFAIGLLFFTTMSYYAKPEEKFFVWMYSVDSRPFLRTKIKTALWCATILTTPILIALMIAYPTGWLIIIGTQVMGYLFLIAMVLAKYSAFPKEINIPQAILLGLSILFLPMILFTIPIFYKQSIKRLKPILEGW